MKNVVIVGAGPAGLTAAARLAESADHRVIVLEKESFVGGISRTARHNGNRIDIGGHRFFSKSDEVVDFWREMMPVQEEPGLPPEDAPEAIFMIRPRTSRIFYERKLYDYPVSLSLNTMRNIGFRRLTGVGITYLKSKVRPRPNEDSLEDFLVNRFGERLYAMFFRDYTTKVWGIEPQHISASWGAQRIKGLSLTKAVAHWARSKARRPGPRDFDQKDTETSLIELFMYPRLGPGQFWETIDDWVTERGVEVRKEVEVVGFDCESGRITGVRVQDAQGSVETIPADEVISSMPIPELVAGLDAEVPAEVRAVASGLPFRDFITVGLLVHRLKIGDPDGSLIPDNWIYVQEPDVRVGRVASSGWCK